MERFFEMLTYRRPMDSDTEAKFIERFLGPLGVEVDEAGNIFKRIGDSNVLWSCHTDTVHHSEGMQTIKITDHRVSLDPNSNSNCLGADCGTGVFIMTEMIKAEKPGLYVFHRGEEHGAHGSRHIAKTKTLLNGIDMAIAFDRFGQSSIITHQGGRCASDKFAKSLSEQMPFLSADSGGLFTDTANYDHIVPECTNLSVGYKNHHTSAEYQDLDYLKFFIEQIIKLDTSALTIDRDPSVQDWGNFYFTPARDNNNDEYNFHAWNTPEEDDENSLENLVRNNPKDAAAFMKLYGITASEFMEYCFATSGY